MPTGKTIITRNVTWAHLRPGRSLITPSKPSVVREDNQSGQDREASAANSEIASRRMKNQCQRGPKEGPSGCPDHIGEGPNTYSKSQGQPVRGFDRPGRHDARRESRRCFGSAASTSHGPDKRYTALSAGEAKRLAEYIIPGLPRFSLRGRTRGEERRLTNDAQRLVSLEDELEIAQSVEEESMLEEAYMANTGASIEMPTGKIQDLSLPPTTQAELLRFLFRKAFKNLQRVEIKGLLDVGCFAPVDGMKVPEGQNIVASKWVHTYEGHEQGYCVKTKSRLVAKGFSQVAGVAY